MRELQLQWLLVHDTLGRLWLRKDSESGRGESEKGEDIGGVNMRVLAPDKGAFPSKIPFEDISEADAPPVPNTAAARWGEGWRDR